MHDVESVTFGISQDTFDMLPKTWVMFPCDVGGWNVCWPF